MQHFLKQSALSLARLPTMFQSCQGPRIGSHLRAPSEFEVGGVQPVDSRQLASTPRFGLCSSKRGQRASVSFDSMPLAAGSPVRRCDATGCGRLSPAWVWSTPYSRDLGTLATGSLFVVGHDQMYHYLLPSGQAPVPVQDQDHTDILYRTHTYTVYAKMEGLSIQV